MTASLTERGDLVIGTLTERGELVIGSLTDTGRFVVGTVVSGTTYEKSGGAAADWEAGGALVRQRRRKHVITLPMSTPRPAPPVVVSEKFGGARAICGARGHVTVEKVRSGGADGRFQAAGVFVHALRARHSGARGRLRASGAHTHIYAPQSGGASLTGALTGARQVAYAEQGGGRKQATARGLASILRGDDSEDLMLLGLDPEEEELLLLG